MKNSLNFAMRSYFFTLEGSITKDNAGFYSCAHENRIKEEADDDSRNYINRYRITVGPGC